MSSHYVLFLKITYPNTVNVSLPIFDVHSQKRDAGSGCSCASLCLIEILRFYAIAQQRSHYMALGFQAVMTSANSPMFMDMEI